jgi:hypothetical protein
MNWRRVGGKWDGLEEAGMGWRRGGLSNIGTLTKSERQL